MTTHPVSSFLKLLGIKIEHTNNDPLNTASATLTVKEHHGQSYNVIHGGVLYSLADTLAGYLIWKNIHTNQIVTTVEMKINYVAPVPISGSIKANASIKHLGKRTSVCTVDLFHIMDSKTKLVAIATGTFLIIKSPNFK
ncbi:MAG: PaaI family thioesterase [Candidatus Hodarchaeales archaeon]|jgi:acyl-CoA thioesterase